MVGLVRASNSVGLSISSGETRKYSVEAMILMPTITAKFFNASFTSVMSFVPKPMPNPMIGPINGEINIAPIITGMEFTFNPTDAMIIAKKRMNTFGPRKWIFSRILVAAACTSIASPSDTNCFR